MKGEKLRNNYLKVAYRLVRLFNKKRHISTCAFDDEFEIDTSSIKCYKEKLKDINDMIKKTEMELNRIARDSAISGTPVQFEMLAQKYKLTNEEKYILLCIFFEQIQTNRSGLRGHKLLNLLGYGPEQFIEKSKLLKNLLRKRLIKIEDYSEPSMIFDAEFTLPMNILREIAGNSIMVLEEDGIEVSERRRLRNKQETISVLKVQNPILTFDQIVLSENIKEEILLALSYTKNKNIFQKWGFDRTIKYGKGITMLFYGPPGTGKTAICEAIAHSLKKKIGIVNYAQILSRWVGDSEKNLVKVFEQAKKEDCVLVFDEAEALFGKRFNESNSTDRMCNLMTNILMQELEHFDGMVILTTNREVVIDEAFERRILFKIKFDIPGPMVREKIWQVLMPEHAPLAEDIDFEKLGGMYEFTGGEIKNVIINAVMVCANRRQKKLNMALLMEYAEKEKAKTIGHLHKQLGFAPICDLHAAGPLRN
ncbi:MAG: ATP-binding protein [bacterium]